MESRPRAGTGLRAVKRATTLNVTLSESAGVTVQSYAPVFASPETMVANGPAGPWRETKTFLERESAGPVAQGHLHVPEQQVGGGIVIQVGELRPSAERADRAVDGGADDARARDGPDPNVSTVEAASPRGRDHQIVPAGVAQAQPRRLLLLLVQV